MGELGVVVDGHMHGVDEVRVVVDVVEDNVVVDVVDVEATIVVVDDDVVEEELESRPEKVIESSVFNCKPSSVERATV